MATSPSFAAVQSARRFIGRRATACRKHGDPGQQHHVNRMGGLVCSACHPLRTEADCVLRLVICGGMWDDADNPFDFQGSEIDEAAKTVARSGTTAPRTGSGPTTNIDETTTSELATPREAGNSRRVGEPLLELEINFFMSLPVDGMPLVVKSSEIGREPAERKTERERAGLLESGALDRGFVGGFVRRGQSVGPGCQLAAMPTINTQFAVGQVVRLLRRLETFRGFLQPQGGFVINSIGKDFEGWPLVALSLGGDVVVSGLVPDEQIIRLDGDPVSVDELIG